MGNCCCKKKVEPIDTSNIWSFIDECSICMENPTQAALLECNHLCCVQCAKKLIQLKYCPWCRAEINGYATFTPNIHFS